MMKILPFPSFCFSLLLIIASFSQSIAQQWQYDFGMAYTRPLDEFRSDGYNDGFGLNMGVYSSPIRANNGFAAFRIGMRADFDFAGKSEQTLIAPIPETNLFGEMRLQNTSLGLHGVFRIETQASFPVQLYAEGLIGSRALYTNEAFNDHDNWDEDECIDFTIYRNWSLSYGAAVGTLIRLGDEVRLNLRASYMTSTPTRFVDLATAQQVEDNLYTYQTQTAPATQLRLEGGLNFDLDMRCAPSRSEVRRKAEYID